MGDGYGVLGVEVPVRRQRGYVFTVEARAGPGLNTPLTLDPSGLFLRREGHAGDYLVGKLPGQADLDIPVNQHGSVHPDYWEEEVKPLLQARFNGSVFPILRGKKIIINIFVRFENCLLKGSQAVDYDFNYFDGTPILGPHPYVSNLWLACGFGGLGSTLAPAVGRACTELMLDSGYKTIDLSRLAFDRVLMGKEVRELAGQMLGRT